MWEIIRHHPLDFTYHAVKHVAYDQDAMRNILKLFLLELSTLHYDSYSIWIIFTQGFDSFYLIIMTNSHQICKFSNLLPAK